MWMIFREQHAESQRLFDSLLKAGFEAVALPHRQAIIQALDLLDNATQTGFTHFRQRLRLRRKLHKLQVQSTPKDISQLKHLLAQCREVQLSQKYTRLLDSSDFWNQQFDAVRCHSQIRQPLMKLSKQWRKNHYRRYSTTDLLSVYQTVLPLFANWLHYAQTELAAKSQGLNHLLSAEYAAYLQELSQELKMEEQEIRHSFQERLTAGAERRDWRFDQLVFSFMERVRQLLGITPPTDEPNVASLSSHQFQQMQQIIEEDGDDEEKNALHSLPYYSGMDLAENQTLNSLSPYRRNHKQYIYQIPPTLVDEIPINLPFYLKLPQWLQGLFKGDQARYLFFQNAHCQTILTSIQAFAPFSNWYLNQETPLAEIHHDRRWQQFGEMLADLKYEKERAQQTMNPLSALFHHSTCQMLEHYQAWIQTTAKQALNRQLNQLDHYLEAHFQMNALQEADREQIEHLIEIIEHHNRYWQAELEGDLVNLRLKIAHLHEKPLYKEQLKSSEDHPFRNFYIAIYQIIETYQAEQIVISEIQQQHLNVLKEILKHHAAEQKIWPLYQAILAYRPQMEPDRPGKMERLWNSNADLAGKIDAVLEQPCYKETLLIGYELAEQSATLHTLANPVIVQSVKQHPFSPSVVIEEDSLDWIKNPLEKNIDELKSDMQRLEAKKPEYFVFRHQVHGYVHHLVAALKALSSEESFRSKETLFNYILQALLNIAQETPLSLSYLLKPLQEAQTQCHRIRHPQEQDDWPFIVQVFFEPILEELAQQYSPPNFELNPITPSYEKPIEPSELNNTLNF